MQEKSIVTPFQVINISENQQNQRNPADLYTYHSSSELLSYYDHIINLQHDWGSSTKEILQEPISEIALVDYCPHMATHWDAGRLVPVSLPLCSDGMETEAMLG